MSGPILLFGMPRSGTTWLGKIFDSHPETLYRHEPDSFQRMNFMPVVPAAVEDSRFAARLNDYLARMPAIRAAKVVAKQPLFPKVYAGETHLALFRLGTVIAAAASRAGVELPVLGTPQGNGDPRVRLVWKSIESLGRLPLILDAVPQARAVHIIRHPCGYVASVLRGEAQRKFTYNAASEDYGIFTALLSTEQAQRYGLDLTTLKSLTPVERLSWRWLLFNEKALQEVGEGTRVRVLRYEDLCFDSIPIAKSLFQFCGLDWHVQSEEFIRRSTEHASSAYYSVFKDPRRSALKWRQQLSDEQIDKILAVARRSPASALFEDGTAERTA